jgi:hypothetical protein
MGPQADHFVLLGDSIFDNGAYVPGEPDVIAQLRRALPAEARATLLAVDGAVVADIPGQLARLPADVSWIVVSAGGNDALGQAHLLSRACRSVGEGVAILAEVRDRFAKAYGAMVDLVLQAGVRTALCTIYDAAFPPPDGRIVTAALCLFNDVITRTAFARGLPLVDLRLICCDPADYANPIEPSSQGGDKIARTIARLPDEGSDGPSRVLAWPGG